MLCPFSLGSFFERFAVRAFTHGRVCFVCADLDAGKRAVVFGVAMILAFLHAAADAHIRFVVHTDSASFCVL